MSASRVDIPIEEDGEKTQPVKRVLSKRNRCDQCGYQAFYHATFEFGDLLFCRHHYYRNEEFIYENAIDLVDESEYI